MTATSPPGRLARAYAAQAAALQDPRAVADLQRATWQAVDAALRDVIGPLGVAALLARGLVLAQRRHASLAAALPRAHPPDGTEQLLNRLHSTLQQLALAEAQAASQTLVQMVADLLDSLIGAALAEHLLQPVWQPPPGEPHPEDITP